jgi:hypothetical protein
VSAGLNDKVVRVVPMNVLDVQLMVGGGAVAWSARPAACNLSSRRRSLASSICA